MKTNLPLSILLACIGTLSTSLLIYAPAGRAGFCESTYPEYGGRRGSGYSGCLERERNRKFSEDLKKIPSDINKIFGTDNNSPNNNNSSYGTREKPNSSYENRTITTDEGYASSGHQFRDVGNQKAAIAAYSKAIELKPNEASHYEFRGHAFLSSGDKQSAIADFSQCINLGSRSRCYAYRGDIYFSLAEYSKAIDDYSKWLEKIGWNNLMTQDIVRYHNNRGIARYRSGDKQGALADYSQAISLNANDAVIYNNRGDNYYELARYQEAIADYSKAIELKPNDPQYYLNRAKSRFASGDKQGAAADFSQLISLNPQDITNYQFRASIYSDLGKYQEAIADYDKAIELNPSNAFDYNNRGTVRHKAGDNRGALADYNKAMALAPNNVNVVVYFNRGKTYHFLKNHKLANVDFDRVAAMCETGKQSDPCKELLKKIEQLKQ